MNIRKGFFRLTLVLSILIGTIAPFCHEWIFDEKNVFKIFSLPDDWGKKSLQERFNSVDEFLLTRKQKGEEERVTLGDVVREFREATAKKSLKAKIEELNIRRQIRETINSEVEIPPNKWDKYRVYDFSFKIGRRELSLLAFVGFASPWFIYLFTRWIIVAFIIGGFKVKS